MNTLTREQRVALKRVFDRGPIDHLVDFDGFSTTMPMSYRQFRKTVSQGYDCIMVQWAGMWLGIETDGYTHS